MTIEELLAATGLTANDLVPIWDAEAAQSVEPTQKVTAAQLAAAVKVLASLVNTTEMNAAIAQSTAPITERLTWSSGIKPTLTNGSHYNVGTWYWKRGSIVYLHISVQFDSAPTNVLLFTLPAGYRPIGNAEITASGGGSYNAKAQCRITDNGSVYVTSVDKWVSGSGMFIYAT